MNTLRTMLFAAVVAFSAPGVLAQSAAPVPTSSKAAGVTKAPLSEHARKDIQRHRAMAGAHEAAARCLEAGRSEEDCLKELQMACKGLALGKYCGMRHEH